MANRRHNFTIFPQSYKYGCWLASTHSLNIWNLYGGYYQGGIPWPVSLYADHTVNYHPGWLGENNGLLMDSNILSSFASDNNLGYQKIYGGDTSIITSKISQSPVMVAGRLTNTSDAHFYIVSGVKGNSLYWHDPKPDGQGSWGVATIADFKKTFPDPFQYIFWPR